MRPGVRAALALVAVLCVAATACSRPERGGGGETAEGTDETLLIGVTVEKTGPVPVLGLTGDGAEAAAEDINSGGGILGRQVELVVRDNAGDPSRAIDNIREFSSMGVDFVVGPAFGQDCTAVAPELAEAEMVGFCLSPNDLPEGTSHMFGIGVGYTPTVDFTSEWLSGRGELIGILGAKDESNDETVDLSEVYGPQYGVEFAVEQYEEGDTSARSQIQRLMSQDVDAIYLPSCGPSVITFSQEAIQLGFAGTILFQNCMASPDVAESVAGFADSDQLHIMAPEFVLGDVPADSDRAEAIENYTEVLDDPNITVAAGWDGMKVLAQALEATGSTDPAEAIATLEGDFTYHGVWSAGTITADDHRGAVVEGALVPARFTADGELVRAD